MFGFGNEKHDNTWDFWSTSSDDNCWGFSESKENGQVDDLWGISEREGKSFWETLADLFSL